MSNSAGGGVAAPDSTADQPPPPPTHPNRRPRVREVSSRFMTPLIHSNSTPNPNPTDLPKSRSSVQRRLIPKTDENHVPETNRSIEKPVQVPSTVQKKQNQRKQQSGGEVKEGRVKVRPDTPVANMATDRIVPSRYNNNKQGSVFRANSLNNSSSSCSTVTAAARLLQEATSDIDKGKSLSRRSRDDSDACSTASSNQGTSSCPNSPLWVPLSRQRSVPDSRTSMPDVEKWLAERNFGNVGKSTSDCARSLHFSSKLGAGVTLPPQHPSLHVRSGLDVKKGKGGSSYQEDVHSLKMLHNHCLQWRLANAKAEACAQAQKQEAERKLYSLGAKISDLRDNLQKKRNELAVLRRIQTLNTIVEAQMPPLEEWSAVEEDYSTSLSGTMDALLNSSARLPISGNVRFDTEELQEAMSSALKVAETIGSHIHRFTQKAEEMDVTMSELAKLAGGERSLLEECGYLLAKSHASQVTECSLRGTIMQLHTSSDHQTLQTIES